MGPDDPFLNVEKPIQSILFIGSGSPVQHLSVKLRLLKGGGGTGQKLFERSEFFWPGVFVSFFAKKESPRQGMEVAPAIG